MKIPGLHIEKENSLETKLQDNIKSLENVLKKDTPESSSLFKVNISTFDNNLLLLKEYSIYFLKTDLTDLKCKISMNILIFLFIFRKYTISLKII